MLGRDRSYFVKMHSDSAKKFSETDIINMLEFLIDNIFVIFGGRVFQQTVGITMGTNSRFGNFVDRIYPIELEIQDTPDTDRSASHLDLHLEMRVRGGYERNFTTKEMISIFPL